MLITALFVTGKESWKLSLAAGTELSLPVSPSVVFGVPLVCRDLNTGKTPSLMSKFHDKPPQAALELIRNRKAPKNMRTFKRRVAIKITCACVKQMLMSDVLPTCMSVQHIQA